MGQMRPHYEGGDVKRKLWDHLHLIADMELEVDSPYPLPEPEAIFAKPDPLKYSDRSATFKQYGKNIEYIINSAIIISIVDNKRGYYERNLSRYYAYADTTLWLCKYGPNN
jgi:hypothetical protein